MCLTEETRDDAQCWSPVVSFLLLQTEVLEALCGCLRELPDQLLDQLTQDVHVPDVKTVFVRCHLVGDGSQPLAWLNPVLEAAFSQHHRYRSQLWGSATLSTIDEVSSGNLATEVTQCSMRFSALKWR